MTTKLEEIMTRWQTDFEFREEFKKNPEFALKQAGFELTPEDLALFTTTLTDRSTLKGEELDKRVNK